MGAFIAAVGLTSCDPPPLSLSLELTSQRAAVGCRPSVEDAVRFPNLVVVSASCNVEYDESEVFQARLIALANNRVFVEDLVSPEVSSKGGPIVRLASGGVVATALIADGETFTGVEVSHWEGRDRVWTTGLTVPAGFTAVNLVDAVVDSNDTTFLGGMLRSFDASAEPAQPEVPALWALSDDGEVLWERELGALGAAGSDHTVSAIAVGPAGNVLVAVAKQGDRSIVSTTLHALDSSSGATLLSAPLPPVQSLAEVLVVTSILVEPGGAVTLAGFTSEICEPTNCSGMVGWVRRIPVGGGGWQRLYEGIESFSDVKAGGAGALLLSGRSAGGVGDVAQVAILEAASGLVLDRRSLPVAETSSSSLELLLDSPFSFAVVGGLVDELDPAPDSEGPDRRAVTLHEFSVVAN